jgi:hypothetical protein
MTAAEIAALRAAAATMIQDGQILTAGWLALEAGVAEAFDGAGYPLGAPNRHTLKIADECLAGAS